MSQECHIAWLIAAAQNTHQTTEEEPQYFIKSDRTEHLAIHTKAQGFGC
jgi:hypothetical protein